MTFLEIVNEVLFDRFKEARRASVKRYVNARYGRVWAQEAWTFKRVVASTTLAADASSVTLATLGLQRVEAVFRSNGNLYYNIESLRPEDFYDWASLVNTSPLAFTIYGDAIHFEHSPSSDETIYVIGEQKFIPLAADGDEPLIPEEFHMMLVHGAASEALRMENDPTWQGFEQDYQAYLNDLRMGYLTATRTYGDAYPAWVPSAF